MTHEEKLQAEFENETGISKKDYCTGIGDMSGLERDYEIACEEKIWLRKRALTNEQIEFLKNFIGIVILSEKNTKSELYKFNEWLSEIKG